MCRAVVPRVGAGEREVTLTVNGKIPSRARTGVGGRKVERDSRHLGPRQCPTGLSLVLGLASPSNYGSTAMMSNLVKFMSEPTPMPGRTWVVFWSPPSFVVFYEISTLKVVADEFCPSQGKRSEGHWTAKAIPTL